MGLREIIGERRERPRKFYYVKCRTVCMYFLGRRVKAIEPESDELFIELIEQTVTPHMSVFLHSCRDQTTRLAWSLPDV